MFSESHQMLIQLADGPNPWHRVPPVLYEEREIAYEMMYIALFDSVQ